MGGALFGSVINPSAYGIPFAMPALFICLLMFQLKSKIHFRVMGLAAVLSVLFKAFLPDNWYMIGAALIASIAGLLIEGAWRKQEESKSNPL